jgi:protein-S-isoprenylcysteine O-methyltransferase Ste14
MLASACFIMTATMEEFENEAYFGDAYREYVKHSKMFIPYLF